MNTLSRIAAWSIWSACVMNAVGFADAAELPSRAAPASPPAATACQFGGAPGIKLPGSDVCVKIYGDADVEISGTGGKAGSAASQPSAK